MLDKRQLLELCEALGTPTAGRNLVAMARKNAPVRPVKSRGGNVVTLMASRKMACEIRTESRHLEFAAAVHLEFDDAVLEFYPQPCELHFDVTDPATGEIHHIHHTPDFLSISSTGFQLIECKSHAKLQSLARRAPWRYQQDIDGQWFAPLLQAHFANLGIAYELWTENTLSPLRTENLLHLADYLLPGAEECPSSTLETIEQLLQEHGHLYVSELLAAPYHLSADHINKAIADQLLVTNLESQTLSKPSRCRIFRDATLMQFVLADTSTSLPAQERFDFDLRAGAVLMYQGQALTISLAGGKELVCTSQDGSTRTLSQDWVTNALESGQVQMQSPVSRNASGISQFSETQLQQALARQQQFATANPYVSQRTLRRWTQRQHEATANGGNSAVALIPHTEARGNRTSRLTQEQHDVLQHVIRTEWVTTEAKNYKACYRILRTARTACDEKGIPAPSYPTLISTIKAQQTNREVRIRHGKRMAYQQNTFVEVLHADTPQHGSRPFQYVHIDHTQLDIELVSGRTDKRLGRPWLTLAIDAYSRRIVALYLTYEPPSYTSVMMCMRIMVQRYKRLPEFVIVDNGKDLTSTAFSTFLSAMGVHLRLRPAGQPRHGAVLERLFGRMHSEYVHNLAGNTKATKNVRMTTGKHLPQNFALWTLENMYHGLVYWAFEYYEQEVHSALDMSPRQAFERGLAHTGNRAHRMVLCNQDFMIATCPPVDRAGHRKVDGQRGVKVNDLLYWHPAFAAANIAGHRCAVRYDPWDASSVYVWANKMWLRAQCRSLLELGQLTETERQTLSEEYRNRSGKKVDEEVSTQRLKEFIRTFNPEGALALFMERQQENKQLYSRLDLANVSNVELPRKPGTLQPLPSADVTPDTATAPSLTKTPSMPVARPRQPALEDGNDFFDTF